MNAQEINHVSDELSSTLVSFNRSGHTPAGFHHVSLLKALETLTSKSGEFLSKQVRSTAMNYFSVCRKHDLDYRVKGIKHTPETSAAKKLRDDLKKSLPSVCISARMAEGQRNEEAILEYTGFTQLDLDHVEFENIQTIKNRLAAHPSVVCAFVSPSGDGVKAIVKIPKIELSDPQHKEKYRILHAGMCRYFSNITGVQADTSIKDASRICYLPFDQEAVVKHDVKALELPKEEALIPSTADVQEQLSNNGCDAEFGGGPGQRQPGYENVAAFRALLAGARVELGTPSKVVHNADSSVTYFWNVTCPTEHSSGDPSKSCVIFNDGGNVRFPAGFHCFSEKCHTHTFAWYAKAIGIPGQSVVEQAVHKMNKKYAMIRYAGSVRVVYQAEEKLDFTDNKWQFGSVREIKDFEMNNRIDIPDANGKLKNEGVFDVWLRHEARRSYSDGITFDPSGRTYKTRLNLFEGWGTVPKQGDWHLMREHILNIICSGNKKLYNWLLDWMAWPLCNPSITATPSMKTSKCPVLQSSEGTGKGTFAQWLLKIYGSHGIQLFQSKHLSGNFNAHLATALLAYADEACFAGNEEAAKALRGLISETDLPIEKKKVDVVTVKSGLNIMMSTNNDWAVNINEDNRRYVVIKVSDAARGNIQYFNSIMQEKDNGGVEAMYYDLLLRKPTFEAVLDSPDTDGNKSQAIRSSTVLSYFAHIAHTLRHGIAVDGCKFKALPTGACSAEVANDVWPELVAKDAFYTAYTKHKASTHSYGSPDPLPKFLREYQRVFGIDVHKDKRILVNEVRERAVPFPTPEQFEERFPA